jgi:retron-type reverse transcriptase
MKRHGDLFDNISSKENILGAYRRSRKGKNWQDTVKRFDANADANLEQIRRSLISKSFSTSAYKEMVIHEPKERIVYKLPFAPDRIVQHALMNVLGPLWEKTFIRDSYSCRKGRGIHAGSRRTMDFIRAVGPHAYCLKMDVAKFYPSVDHDILFDIVQQKIKCKDTLWLLHDIIYSFPGKKNVPIGNYTSQWFCNLYLNELDTFLKHRHHIKYYIRYCDDFIILHEDKRYLKRLAEEIEQFLEERLALKLSKNSIFPIKHGIDFLGYRHFPGYILIRKSTVKRTKHRLSALPGKLASGEISLDQYRSSLASTMGWLKWANSYHLRTALGLDKLQEVLHHA